MIIYDLLDQIPGGQVTRCRCVLGDAHFVHQWNPRAHRSDAESRLGMLVIFNQRDLRPVFESFHGGFLEDFKWI